MKENEAVTTKTVKKKLKQGVYERNNNLLFTDNNLCM